MANTLTDIIPRVLARGLLKLRGALTMPALINSDYGPEARTKNSTIDIPVGAAATVGDVTPSNTPPALTDKTPTQVQLTLDQWKYTDFHLTDSDMQKIMMSEHFMPLQLDSAIDAIVENINGYLLGRYVEVPNFVGTAGTTPFQSDATAIINARKKLNEQKAPLSQRRFVMDVDAEAEALGLSTFADAEKTGENGVKIEGQLGRKYGFDNYFDQQVPTHTLVGAGTPLVDGASTAGATTIVIDGWTTKPEAGDIFTIAGDDTQYVVVSSTDLSTGESTVTVSPPLAQAHADNAAVTLVATHVVNLAFHRDAFAFAMRPLVESTVEFALGSLIQSMTDPVTGITLRLEVKRVHKAVVWDLDVLYGAKLIRTQLATRVLG